MGRAVGRQEHVLHGTQVHAAALPADRTALIPQQNSAIGRVQSVDWPLRDGDRTRSLAPSTWRRREVTRFLVTRSPWNHRVTNVAGIGNRLVHQQIPTRRNNRRSEHILDKRGVADLVRVAQVQDEVRLRIFPELRCGRVMRSLRSTTPIMRPAHNGRASSREPTSA